MTASKPLVVGLGEVLWDMFPDGRVLGGAVANVAWHANQMRCDARVISAVGDDEPGRDIIDFFRQHDMATDGLAVDPNYPTSTVEVRLKNGLPSYIIHPDVAWDFLGDNQPEDRIASLASKAAAVCFGSLSQRSESSRRFIHDFLDAADTKALRVFDVNLRQEFYSKDILEASLRHCNVLKINDEELPVLADLLCLPSDAIKTLRRLCDKYDLTLAALTRGAAGSLLMTPTQVSEIPGRPVEIADTVGAGDAFAAGLIAGMLYNQPLAVLHERATEAAEFVCTQQGATPRLPEALTRFDPPSTLL